jgi:non-heme chloroperoxidase
MHADEGQIGPYADSGPFSAKLVHNGTFKTHGGISQGMPTTEVATINADSWAAKWLL